jgi:hypothetical protein
MAIRLSSLGGTPFGDTANRPSNPNVGQTYNNGEVGYLEIYTSAGWIPASGGNDFNLNLTGIHTAVTFAQSYGSGSYSVTSGSNDATIDIYAFAPDGSLAGYTNTKSFTATQRFNKMVIIGGTTGDVLGFSFKTTYATSSTTSEVTAGPFITSISPSFMANINDTVTITGGNFAEDVEVAFTGTGYSSTAAKSIVRSSSSQLIVTRPDNFPPSASPYTITVVNPSVSNQPTGTAVNISSNSVTAGNAPVWVTNSSLPVFTRNIAYSTTIQATDADGGSSVTYSIVSGSLATGLSLNASTGVISGTPTSSINTSFTIRVTDTGGNFVDRAFTMTNLAPVWSTTAGALTAATKDTAYSLQLSVTDDNTVAYSLLSGSLPTGITLSSSGLLSGTPTVASLGSASSFTIRATDLAGSTTDRSFSLYVLSTITSTFTSSGTWTNTSGTTISSLNVVLVAGGGSGGTYGQSNVGCGGGGAGGVVTATLSNVAPGTSYTYTIGGGGAAVSGSPLNGNNGSGSTFTGITSAVGGGYGGTNTSGGNSGGSGGGGSRGSGGSGTAGQGNSGNSGDGTQYGGGGGGGKNASGGNPNGGAGASYYGVTVAGGGGGGVAGGPSTGGSGGSGVGGAGGGSGQNGFNAAANTGSGGGGAANVTSGSGSSGLLILNYLG